MNNPRSSLQIAFLGNFAIFTTQGLQQLNPTLHALFPCLSARPAYVFLQNFFSYVSFPWLLL